MRAILSAALAAALAQSCMAFSASLPIRIGRYVEWGVGCDAASRGQIIDRASRHIGVNADDETCRVTSVTHHGLYHVDESCAAGGETAFVNVVSPTSFAVLQIQRGGQLAEVHKLYRLCASGPSNAGEPAERAQGATHRMTHIDAGVLHPGVSCFWYVAHKSVLLDYRLSEAVVATDMETITAGIDGTQDSQPYHPEPRADGSWGSDFSLDMRGLTLTFTRVSRIKSLYEGAWLNYALVISDASGHEQKMRLIALCGA